MARDKNWQLLLAFLVIGLLIGSALGGFLFSKTEIEYKDKIVYQDKIVEKEVTVPVTVIKEAPRELDKAVITFLIAVEDEEDEAGNDLDLLKGYDFDEVSLNKLYEDHVVQYVGDKTIVEFQVRLKYKEDGESSEKEVYDVVVTYEEGEDSIVEATIV